MKAVLVYPNSFKMPNYFNSANNITIVEEAETLPPLGLLYIISNSKYDIDIIDNRVERLSDVDLARKLMQYDIIGFGGTIFEIKQARRVSQALMKKGKITVYGGPNATVNYNLYLGSFNFIVRGEAEEVFDKILENNTEDFFNVNGTWITKTIMRIKNLDALKFPARNKIDLTKYRRKEPYYLSDEPIDTIASTRGCCFNCNFCSSAYIWQRQYSSRSVDNVILEIKQMRYEHGTQAIYFREDNFTLNRARLIEFCAKMKPLNMNWMCESRVDTLDEATIQLMSESNCKGMWFGIESTSNDTLKIIKKGFTIEQAKETIRLCKKYGIKTGGGFMVGFPHETKKDVIRTIRDSKKLELDNPFYSRVWAIPKSEMYTQIVNEGLDYYTHENIILPSTRHIHADVLNKIFYDLIVRRKMFIGKIASYTPSKIKERIKNTKWLMKRLK